MLNGPAKRCLRKGCLAVVVIVAASCSTHSASPARRGSSPSPDIHILASPTMLPPRHVGGTVAIESVMGPKLAVTLQELTDPAEPLTEFDSPRSNSRLVAVKLQMVNHSAISYKGVPSGDFSLIDDDGTRYAAVFKDAAGCTAFGPGLVLAPGDSVIGCEVFDVGIMHFPAQVRFDIDNPLGQTAIWLVP